jgi:hypothetical protein
MLPLNVFLFQPRLWFQEQFEKKLGKIAKAKPASRSKDEP